MGDVSSAGRKGLRNLEGHYRDEIKLAIKKMRDWEDRRVESDVVQLVLDQEGQVLRDHINQMRQLHREARSWRVAPRP